MSFYFNHLAVRTNLQMLFFVQNLHPSIVGIVFEKSLFTIISLLEKNCPHWFFSVHIFSSHVVNILSKSHPAFPWQVIYKLIYWFNEKKNSQNVVYSNQILQNLWSDYISEIEKVRILSFDVIKFYLEYVSSRQITMH